MAGLRELLGGKDDQDSVKNCIIEIYREYNIPLPEELITKITNLRYLLREVFNSDS